MNGVNCAVCGVEQRVDVHRARSFAANCIWERIQNTVRSWNNAQSISVRAGRSNSCLDDSAWCAYLSARTKAPARLCGGDALGNKSKWICAYLFIYLFYFFPILPNVKSASTLLHVGCYDNVGHSTSAMGRDRTLKGTGGVKKTQGVYDESERWKTRMKRGNEKRGRQGERETEGEGEPWESGLRGEWVHRLCRGSVTDRKRCEAMGPKNKTEMFEVERQAQQQRRRVRVSLWRDENGRRIASAINGWMNRGEDREREGGGGGR